MLALDAKATMDGFAQMGQFKVAGLAQFSSGRVPLERMLLDCRGEMADSRYDEVRGLPWAGYLVDEASPVTGPQVRLQGDPRVVQPGDVIEVRPTIGKVAVRHRRGDNGNVLFATERCNSYCLMCSQPPRDVDDRWRIAQLCDLIPLIDEDEPSLAISGGEPTLLGAGLLEVVRTCATHLPSTHVHILSNARRLAEFDYTQTFADSHPSLSWGVPLYGDHAALHDYVVQRAGAFAETLRGLYALHAAGQRIEVRVVLVKPTVLRLRELVRYLYRNLPFVEHVALMGIESIGFARANREALWIDPVDMAMELLDATQFLSERGMVVSVYNLPLCTLPRELWPYAQRSISNWKQDYLPVCEGCYVKERCSGFFSWATEEWRSRAVGSIESIEVMDA